MNRRARWRSRAKRAGSRRPSLAKNRLPPPSIFKLEHSYVVEPDRSRRARLVRPLVEDEHDRPHLVEVEAAVRRGVDRPEAREREGDPLPLPGRSHGGEPPLRALVLRGRVLVADLDPDAVLAVRADREDEALPAREVALRAVHEGGEDVRVLRLGEPEPELQAHGSSASDSPFRIDDLRLHGRIRVDADLEGRLA